MIASQVSGRILALDPGERRVGIAISDETNTIAAIALVLQASAFLGDCQHLASLIQEYNVGHIVVGNPVRLNGSSGAASTEAIALKTRLEQVLTIPVTLWDERFTTTMATQALIEGGVRRRKRKGLVDKVAATLILQSFLDHLAR